MWVNYTGRNDGMPLNERATDYILVHSTAAAQGRMAGAHRDAYGLYGPVVITGTLLTQDRMSVPDRLVEHFQLEAPEPRQDGRDAGVDVDWRPPNFCGTEPDPEGLGYDPSLLDDDRSPDNGPELDL